MKNFAELSMTFYRFLKENVGISYSKMKVGNSNWSLNKDMEDCTG